MNLVDANVLLNAINGDAPQHEPARRWLQDALSGEEAVAFGWSALTAFLRLSTSSSVFARPLTIEDAASFVEDWLAQPNAVVLEPTARHLGILRGLLASAGSAGNLVNDAHLAALALEHGAEIVTFDRDFGRFTGVRWSIPD
jgi:toxin-antitoxin system PIN domain toxin